MTALVSGARVSTLKHSAKSRSTMSPSVLELNKVGAVNPGLEDSCCTAAECEGVPAPFIPWHSALAWHQGEVTCGLPRVSGGISTLPGWDVHPAPAPSGSLLLGRSRRPACNLYRFLDAPLTAVRIHRLISEPARDGQDKYSSWIPRQAYRSCLSVWPASLYVRAIDRRAQTTQQSLFLDQEASPASESPRLGRRSTRYWPCCGFPSSS